jgi:hypothetical protein
MSRRRISADPIGLPEAVSAVMMTMMGTGKNHQASVSSMTMIMPVTARVCVGPESNPRNAGAPGHDQYWDLRGHGFCELERPLGNGRLLARAGAGWNGRFCRCSLAHVEGAGRNASPSYSRCTRAVAARWGGQPHRLRCSSGCGRACAFPKRSRVAHPRRGGRPRWDDGHFSVDVEQGCLFGVTCEGQRGVAR